MSSPSSSSSVSPASSVFAPATSPSFYRRAVIGAFRGMRSGRLRIELPDGGQVDFGEGSHGGAAALPLELSSHATIRVRREAFFQRCVLGGDIGFAESYIAGDWETPDLTSVIAWFILNVDQAPTLSGSSRGRARSWTLNLLRFVHRIEHLLQPNSRRNARSNIARHYDLSNEFFALFLDPTMMYSSAKYTSPDQSLEEAQRAKNEALCRSLRLGAGDHVLEIGSGWGGWAIHAASTTGCRVTTVTLSRQQLELARARVAAAGLADRIEVRLQDYRDIEGRFDKIVSIEMMEAIGHAYLPAFCQALHRLLKPDGLLALQFITCPDSRYAELRRGVDFIQKHIFPGSLLLSLNRVNDLLSRIGGFGLHQIDDLGHDYARTLKVWRERFLNRLDEVRGLGFDDPFIRKWTYYLCYCEAAFAMRNISVVQTLHTRANNLSF
ncbi:MAG TPA: cyclopropane-fatty-acyl-phospholipid synthase family protein [Opitutaceae bacterium]|jgi:cyclopropane-fatty-acyl-phospholipid synthase|nr:cyclopropane-fatty-acyl-phospholipid synthase family protein [Opitutaceae bacterium]